MIKRLLVFLFGVVSYAIFFGTFLYAVGFIGNVFVPRSMDAAVRVHWSRAFAIDMLLLGIFAVQHSVMARPGFKRLVTRLVPQPAERSLYVLASSVALILLFAYWEPIGGTLWNIESATGKFLVNCALGLGFGIVLLTTFLINHFDLFGLRQVWLYLTNREYTNTEFRTPLFYKMVRHPLYVGWMIAFWATPTMTGAHLLFAIVTTVYMVMAVRWEERDLLEAHGEVYARYRREVPRFVPALTSTAVPQSKSAKAA